VDGAENYAVEIRLLLSVNFPTLKGSEGFFPELKKEKWRKTRNCVTLTPLFLISRGVSIVLLLKKTCVRFEQDKTLKGRIG